MPSPGRSEEHTSELQSQSNLVCRLLLEKKNKSHNVLDLRQTFGRTNASGTGREGGTCSYEIFCEPKNVLVSLFFFFNDTATTEIYTLSLHDALPIWRSTTVCGSARCTWMGGSV